MMVIPLLPKELRIVLHNITLRLFNEIEANITKKYDEREHRSLLQKLRSRHDDWTQSSTKYPLSKELQISARPNSSKMLSLIQFNMDWLIRFYSNILILVTVTVGTTINPTDWWSFSSITVYWFCPPRRLPGLGVSGW